MLFSSAFVASSIAAFLSNVHANPTPNTTVEEHIRSEALNKRNVGGVYMCTNINWGGECEYDVWPLDECWEVTGDFYYTISSFGVDLYTMCTIWYDSECSDNGPNAYPTDIIYPGYADMAKENWNDAVGSFKCEYYAYSGGGE